jgi:hypothetical protein
VFAEHAGIREPNYTVVAGQRLSKHVPPENKYTCNSRKIVVRFVFYGGPCLKGKKAADSYTNFFYYPTFLIFKK